MDELEFYRYRLFDKFKSSDETMRVKYNIPNINLKQITPYEEDPAIETASDCLYINIPMSAEKHTAEIEVSLPKKLLISSFSYQLRAAGNTIQKDIFVPNGE